MRKAAAIQENIATAILWAAAGIAAIILLTIVMHIFANGLHTISLDFILHEPEHLGRDGGIFSTIVGTLYLTLVAIICVSPIGVGAAIYLTEYTQKGRLVEIIRFGTECLAGIPSIIFGLFGYAFFVVYLELGWSILSGGLTLALMILPTIVRTAEEAIKAVPDSYRYGSLALGATRWQTIVGVVLPSALPGILTGIVLGIGRAVGETAAVLLTAGSALGLPLSIFDPVRTMSIHLYILATEGISQANAYGTAVVLIVVIFMINMLAYQIMRRMIAKR